MGGEGVGLMPRVDRKRAKLVGFVGYGVVAAEVIVRTDLVHSTNAFVFEECCTSIGRSHGNRAGYQKNK